MLKPQPWLATLKVREERDRAAAGLVPKIDGWYKTLGGKTRYICKPCPLSEVLAILPGRLEAIRLKMSGGAGVPRPVVARGTLTLEHVGDAYQAWLWQRLTTGLPKKLSRRTYDDAVEAVADFIELSGPQKLADAVGPSEFTAYALAKLAGKAASTIRRRIIYLEAFANWAAPGPRKAALLVRPWQYGPDFRKPSDSEIARSAADSDKAYTAEQLRRAFLRVKRSPMLRAAGWIALTCAFGPKDIGTLPESVIGSDGFIRFARGKTGVGRLGWLPPAARIALKRYMDNRGDKCDPTAEGLAFRSESTGLPLYREAEGKDAGPRYDSIGNQWSKLTGLPLSGLRSTFATVGDDWPDQRAVDVVLGHLTAHTKSVRRSNYAKRFSPERIRLLVCAVLPLAFGRRSRLAAPEAFVLPAPIRPASPRGFDAIAPARPGESGKAGASRRASAHRSRKSRQP